MELKKQENKQVKTQPLANLPAVSLTEKDMSSVSGGGPTDSLSGGSIP